MRNNLPRKPTPEWDLTEWQNVACQAISCLQAVLEGTGNSSPEEAKEFLDWAADREDKPVIMRNITSFRDSIKQYEPIPPQ
jgi:hypothetical protein